MIFPWIQKGGRNLFNRLEARRLAKAKAKAGNGAGVGERTPLIRRKTGDRAVDEANQFDVSHPCGVRRHRLEMAITYRCGSGYDERRRRCRAYGWKGRIWERTIHGQAILMVQTILVFLSVSFDAISLILVSLAQTWQQALMAFAIFALGSGDAPTYKSVFVAAVPDQHASTSLSSIEG